MVEIHIPRAQMHDIICQWVKNQLKIDRLPMANTILRIEDDFCTLLVKDAPFKLGIPEAPCRTCTINHTALCNECQDGAHYTPTTGAAA